MRALRSLDRSFGASRPSTCPSRPSMKISEVSAVPLRLTLSMHELVFSREDSSISGAAQTGLLLAMKIMTGAFDAENGNLIELF